MKAIIVGGGIAGLTTALALHRVGTEVVVLEAVAAIRPLGVGINLLPHSMRILTSLDLQEPLLSQGIETRELVYHNRFGQRIWAEPRGRFAGYPWPQISLHRGVLQFALLNAVRERLGEQVLMQDRRLVRFAQSRNAVTASLVDSDGSEWQVDGDVLIACDGIHSAVRRQLYPEERPPIYSGRILWRGVTTAKPFLTVASMIMAGYQDQKFVCYPIALPDSQGMQPLNWIAELTRPVMPNREDWNRPGQLADFLPPFEGWDFGWLDVPGLLRQAAAIFEYPLVDRDPLPRWTFGRVTLAGDAAHPMYPIGSNGASQAILDADALAAAIASTADVDTALATYETQRRPPTSAIVLANRQNGPEQCMQIAHERAPDGFDDIEAVISRAELEAIAARYKQVAGFNKESLVRAGERSGACEASHQRTSKTSSRTPLLLRSPRET